MTYRTISVALAAAILLSAGAAAARAQNSFTPVVAEVNKKMVKLFGAGGFKGLPSYGSGILVSPKGHILTANNHILATTNLRVHLYDGRLYHAKVIAREPELDVALVKIEEEVDFLPHFDFAKEAARPLAQPGDWALALSNAFQIALRDEPMTVQRGVIAAHAELRGRRGVFEAPFAGEVYFVDAIACNPGAAGGALVNRKGELLGVLGRELKNTLSDTWINYAVPIQAIVEVRREKEEKLAKVSMTDFVRDAIAGKYKQSSDTKRKREDKGGFHGITLVVNATSAVPPYVEEVAADSPASKAGLRPDDLIVYANGEHVPTIRLFRDVMSQFGPNDTVQLQVQRGNRLLSVQLKLAERPKVRASK